MKFFVAVTDYDWFQLHASKFHIDEVNFWRPSPEASFKALNTGEMLLFKLHSPRNFIVGGGFFTRFVHLPISLSWEAFGEGNGVRSLSGRMGTSGVGPPRRSKGRSSREDRLVTLAPTCAPGRSDGGPGALPRGRAGATGLPQRASCPGVCPRSRPAAGRGHPALTKRLPCRPVRPGCSSCPVPGAARLR